METYPHPFFFVSFLTSDLETQWQPFITSSKMQISASAHCKRSHHSLIFPPSNSLLANYCTAVFLRAVQKCNRGRAERAQQRNTATARFFQIISQLRSRGLEGKNCRVWWDHLAFSLLLLLMFPPAFYYIFHRII